MSVESMDWQFPQQPYQPFPPAVITWPTITPPTWVDLAEPGTNYHNLIRISDIIGVEYDNSRKVLVIKTTKITSWPYEYEFSDHGNGLPLFLRSVLETIGALHLLTALKWAEEEPKEKVGA
jgi:hypothetical protein